MAGACESIAQVSPQESPPEIYERTTTCARAGEFEKGLALLTLADIYAAYDQERVIDKSAHPARAAIRVNWNRSLDEETLDAFFEGFKKLRRDEAFRAGMCKQLRAIGPPAYEPRYMAAHGLDAFIGGGGDAPPTDAAPPELRPIDRNQVWEQLLEEYRHCPD